MEMCTRSGVRLCVKLITFRSVLSHRPYTAKDITTAARPPRAEGSRLFSGPGDPLAGHELLPSRRALQFTRRVPFQPAVGIGLRTGDVVAACQRASRAPAWRGRAGMPDGEAPLASVCDTVRPSPKCSRQVCNVRLFLYLNSKRFREERLPKSRLHGPKTAMP